VGSDPLSAETIKLMLSRPPPPAWVVHSRYHFGMGWDQVTRTKVGVRYEKNGGLRGFATWIEHRANGVNWVALFNHTLGRPEGSEFDREFLTRIRRAIDETAAWADIDYF
jgi:hypothetical protein